MKAELSTLCYLEKDNCYLMLHRVKKEHDINKDKWIGVGGHFKTDESPEECVKREVLEETGLTLTDYRYRGLVTFVSGTGVTEYMSLFTATGFEGELINCDEGTLEWVDKADVWHLNLWEGDRIFFRLLDDDEPFFSLKLVYDGQSGLVEATLNGKPMELFDILNEDGSKTGIIRERTVAHRDGSLHGTVHVWCMRQNNDGVELLLQKRAEDKDSYPGCYDISSAGHIMAGDSDDITALREVQEELGLMITPDDLVRLGTIRTSSSNIFHHKPFNNNQLSTVYLCTKAFNDEDLNLQKEELESVKWMDLHQLMEAVKKQTIKHCIHREELDMINDYLSKCK
ncbi:MAG: NUDIX domain-containing protein [Erysipelotrichaceae bacterium]|nr:NUDIX domain-containing protein [Erysipelotrichaceae bacterium]